MVILMNYKVEVAEDTFKILIDEPTTEKCWEYIGCYMKTKIIGVITENRKKCLDLLNDKINVEINNCQRKLTKLHKTKRNYEEQLQKRIEVE